MSHPKRNSEDNPECWKCLIVCCDGTGQAASHGKDGVPSNIARFARALEPADKWLKDGHWLETQQVVLYQTGVGTDAGQSRFSSLFGEAFGTGLDIHVLEAYHFFVNNFEKGDKLFLFGFSRGAFTARAIASFITNVGLLKKEHIEYLQPIYEAYKTLFRPDRRDQWLNWLKENEKEIEGKMHPNVTIPIIGLWDTVGSLGIPQTRFSRYPPFRYVRSWWNDKFAFHDMALTEHRRTHGKGTGVRIERAYQALALDEHRISFGPVLLYTTAPERTPEERAILPEIDADYPIVEQCWFPGVHSDIGGGYNRGYMDVSDLSLTWMMDKCRDHLTFNLKKRGLRHPSKGFEKGTLKTITLQNTDGETLAANPWGLSKLNNSYNSMQWKIAGSRTRKPGEYYLGQSDDGNNLFRMNETIHPSVRTRLMANLDTTKPKKWETYLPPALQGFSLTIADDGGWVYTKEVEGKHGETHTIVIPESQMPSHRWEYELANKDSRNCLEQLRVSNVEESGVNVVLLHIPKEKTLLRTIGGYLPLIVVPVIVGFLLRAQFLEAAGYLGGIARQY